MEAENACLECIGVNELGSSPRLLFCFFHLDIPWCTEILTVQNRKGNYSENYRAQFPPVLFCLVPHGENTSVPNVPAAAQHPQISCTYTHKHTIALSDHTSSCSLGQQATRPSHHVSSMISLRLWLPLFPSSTFTLISSFSFI